MNKEINIKPGYKKTAVGIIPEVWEVEKFEDVFDQLRTYTFSRNELTYEKNNENLYNIHYGDIHSTFPKNILDTEKNLSLIPAVIESKIEAPVLLKEGDLIMADASEDYDGIGQSVELINVGEKKIISGTHTFALRPKFSFAPKYAGYIFSSFNTHKALKKIATGISVFGLSKFNISQIQFPIPPLAEQKLIADCLSTWDKGIEKLTQLIAAKKQQKKGLMQEIFNGQLTINNGQLERVENEKDWLEGWRKVELKECLKYEQPTKYLEKDFDEQNDQNKTPVLTANQSFILGFTSNDEGIYLDFPVIIFDDFTTASRYIDFPFKVKSSAIKFLKEKEGYNLKFMFELLQTIEHDISSHKRRWISEFEIKVIRVPSLQEQTAIAEILQTADQEIELLERKLSSFQQQKKGLMQVLLTGEKRLVD